jgi:hypothetical protein
VREEEDDAAAAAFVVVVVAMLPTGGLLLALSLSPGITLPPRDLSLSLWTLNVPPSSCSGRHAWNSSRLSQRKREVNRWKRKKR